MQSHAEDLANILGDLTEMADAALSNLRANSSQTSIGPHLDTFNEIKDNNDSLLALLNSNGGSLESALLQDPNQLPQGQVARYRSLTQGLVRFLAPPDAAELKKLMAPPAPEPVKAPCSPENLLDRIPKKLPVELSVEELFGPVSTPVVQCRPPLIPTASSLPVSNLPYPVPTWHPVPTPPTKVTPLPPVITPSLPPNLSSPPPVVSPSLPTQSLPTTHYSPPPVFNPPARVSHFLLTTQDSPVVLNWGVGAVKSAPIATPAEPRPAPKVEMVASSPPPWAPTESARLELLRHPQYRDLAADQASAELQGKAFGEFVLTPSTNPVATSFFYVTKSGIKKGLIEMTPSGFKFHGPPPVVRTALDELLKTKMINQILGQSKVCFLTNIPALAKWSMFHPKNKSADFLLVLPYFSTPSEIVKIVPLLFGMVDQADSEALRTEFHTDGEESNRKLKTKLKVLNFVRTWLLNFWSDFAKDPSSAAELAAFLTTVSKAAGEGPVTRTAENLLEILERKKEGEEKQVLSSAKANSAPAVLTLDVPFEGAPTELLTHNSIEIARQLTLREHRLFKNIPSREYIRQSWMKTDDPTKAVELKKMIERFNEVSNWVATEIVKQPQLFHRVVIIEKFIEIAQELHRLHNFNGLTAVVGGLNSSPVSRLKRTWAKVKLPAMQAYESLQTLLSPVSNYKALREATAQVPSTEPLVPYLGIYLGDLTFIEEGNPDVLNDSINFSKWRMVVGTVAQLQGRQQVDYQLNAVYDIQKWLTQVESWNEKECYSRSQSVERKIVEGAAASQKPEVDNTLGDANSPVFTLKLVHLGQAVMLAIRPGVKTYELMDHIEETYPSPHHLSLVSPPGRNHGGIIWKDADLLDKADADTRASLEVWENAITLDLILRLKGRTELDAKQTVFSYSLPLISHVQYLQRFCHIAHQERFSFQKGEKSPGIPKQLTFLRAYDSLDDAAFDVAKECLVVLSHSVLGQRDFDAAPLKTGILKFQSRKAKMSTLSGKKPKNCALFLHFLFVEDVRSSDKPRQIISLEHYNIHKLYDEPSDSAILLLVLNTDVFQFEKDLMVCVVKQHAEYLDSWYRAMSSVACGNPAQIEDFIELVGEGHRWFSLGFNSQKLVYNKRPSKVFDSNFNSRLGVSVTKKMKIGMASHLQGRTIGQKEITGLHEPDTVLSLKHAVLIRDTFSPRLTLEINDRKYDLLFESATKQREWVTAFRLHGLPPAGEPPVRRSDARQNSRDRLMGRPKKALPDRPPPKAPQPTTARSPESSPASSVPSPKGQWGALPNRGTPPAKFVLGRPRTLGRSGDYAPIPKFSN